MTPSPVAVSALTKKQAPMCSLSGIELVGDPEIITRQFTNPYDRNTEPRYAQIFARYSDVAVAEAMYSTAVKAARSCPGEQHIPPKKISKNFILFEHDDTWELSEDTITGWRRLRGFEKHVEPPSATKRNVFYFVYDYAQRGNVFMTTLYWERTEPSDSGQKISQRATTILAKQLTKFG